MTAARSVLLSALLVASAIIGAAWWLVRSQPAPERFQLVNVGQGETQRLDQLSGTITRCYNSMCEDLTKGAVILAAMPKDERWHGEPATRADAVPPPPEGFALDK